MSNSSVKSCLACLGEFDFTDCVTVDDEWSVIKRTYFKKILVAHPDKGGDNDTFRKIQTSFEILRDIYENKKVSSFSNGSSSIEEDRYFTGSSFDDLFSELFKEFGRKTTPSYEFYQEAAEKNVPAYRVELARSARSQCSHTKTASAKKCSAYGAEPAFIAKGEIRFGSMNTESGAYGRWMHLGCWRVPGLIWRGLPCPKSAEFNSQNIARALTTMNEVAFCGFKELSEEDKSKVIAHIMDTSNWAASRDLKSQTQSTSSSTPLSSKHPDYPEVSTITPQATAAAASAISVPIKKEHSTSSSLALTPKPKNQQVFVPPRPGVNGAKVHALAGKTFVLTGIFPEVGGGIGLNLGKDRLKDIITAFGGKVTGSVSGKTDIVVIGKDPGYKKVSEARARDIQMMSVFDLKIGLESGGLIEDAVGTVQINRFSSGYNNNGLANRISSADYASAPTGTNRKLKGSMHSSNMVVKKRATKPKKQTSGKGRKIKITESESEPSLAINRRDTSMTNISCSKCGVDCSARYWFIEMTQTHLCDKCKGRKRKGFQLFLDSASTVPSVIAVPPNKKSKA